MPWSAGHASLAAGPLVAILVVCTSCESSSPKRSGRHATKIATVPLLSPDVVGLAPRVRAPASAGQRQAAPQECMVIITVAAILRDRFVLRSRYVHCGSPWPLPVVRIGGQAPIRLLLTTGISPVSIGSFTGLLADGDGCARVWTTVWPWFARSLPRVRAGGLNQCCGALGGGIIPHAVAGGSHRLVDDVGDRFKITAGGTADQRRLVRQVERIGIQRQRGIRNNGRDIIGAARPQCHRYEPLRAFALIGQRGQRFFEGGIFQHTAQAVGAQ